LGAYGIAKIIPQEKFKYAMIIGAGFLIGGIMNIMEIPLAKWYIPIDLLLAYLPFAYIGYKLATIGKANVK
jgi:hypothetical protein